MAFFEQPLFKPTALIAGADLSAARYKFVKLSADRTVVLCNGITDKPFGVLQNSPGSADAAEVMSMGITKIIPHGTLSAGNQIGTFSDATAQAITAGIDTTVYVAGQIVVGNSGGGSIATAFICCANANRAA